MVLDGFFNFIFGPVVNNLPLVVSMAIITLIITFIITLTYKYLTNQSEIKTAKEETKMLQQELKKHKNNPQKMMEINQEIWKRSAVLMKGSFKPTLITLIPIIIIFGWMSTAFSYDPIKPEQEFTLSATFSKGISGEIKLASHEGLTLSSEPNQEIKKDAAEWRLKGPKGEYPLIVEYNGKSYSRNVIISEERERSKKYEYIKKFKNQDLSILTISYPKRIILNLLGWKLGWLGTYIIFSIIFSIILRKIMKVH